jgi:hypothetical protein
VRSRKDKSNEKVMSQPERDNERNCLGAELKIRCSSLQDAGTEMSVEQTEEGKVG